MPLLLGMSRKEFRRPRFTIRSGTMSARRRQIRRRNRHLSNCRKSPTLGRIVFHLETTKMPVSKVSDEPKRKLRSLTFITCRIEAFSRLRRRVSFLSCIVQLVSFRKWCRGHTGLKPDWWQHLHACGIHAHRGTKQMRCRGSSQPFQGYA
jgi:hypothetical protein